jgi:signal transduction histidine kinase
MTLGNSNKILQRQIKFHVLTIWTVIIVYPVISILDFIYYPKFLTGLLLIRAAVVLCFFVLLMLIKLKKYKLIKFYPVLMIIPATWSLSYMSYYVGDGFSSPYFASNMLIILAVSVTLETSAMEFFMLAFCALPFHFYINSLATKYSDHDMVSNIFFLGLAFVIGSILNILTNQLRKKELEARENNEFLVKVFTHDVKNRITVLYMILDRIRNTSVDRNISKDMEEVIIEQDRISQMVKNLMNCFAMEDSLVIKKKSYSMEEIGEEIAQEWSFKFANRSTKFDVEIKDNVNIRMDHEYMKLAWNNILSNSLQYAGSKGSSKVTLYRENDWIIMSFKNSGKIIPVDFRKHIFDKYLKPEQQSPYSKGLGLHYSKLVVSLHGGTIEYIPHERSKEDEEEVNEFLVKIPA